MSGLFERLKADCAEEWSAYVRHPFVAGLGDGSLPLASFQDYLKQDYLFLIQFARAYALGVYKGRNLAEMRGALDGLKAILDVEMGLHVRLSDRWNVSAQELEQTVEKNGTIAYTRFVLDAGQAGDLLDLFTALAPCMIGYGEIGKCLAGAGADAHDATYGEWVREYASDEYQVVAQGARDNLDKLAETLLTEARYPRLRKLFAKASLLEADFWQMSWEVR
ncbi:MAG: thiaminase II [Pseudomonadota bacterium]